MKELIIDGFAGGGGASEGVEWAHELFAGQGFGPDYIFTHGHDGRKFSKKVQVDKCGNSVCPQMSNVLIGANYQPAAAEVMTG